MISNKDQYKIEHGTMKNKRVDNVCSYKGGNK